MNYFFIFWVVSYLVCTPISTWICCKISKMFTVEDLGIIFFAGAIPFVTVLIMMGFVLVAGGNVVLWREK